MVEWLNALPVESLEEPLRDPRAVDLRRLQAAAEFPIALDESLHLNDAAIGLASLPVNRVVLKPAVVGGVGRTLRLAARLARQGVEVVTTSLIETAAGIWPTLQLTAALGSPLAHGLATSPWLACDLGEAPVPVRGRVILPERTGSGFRPRVPPRGG
jgi:L-alanine-DL-glutamate epimerase-like enolase superfamily enzyme